MTIRETRYGGLYSDGGFALVAGVRDPGVTTPAFGGSVVCADFWGRVRDEGPLVTVELPESMGGDEATIYADAGSHPAELFDRFQSFCDSLDDEHDNRVITETMRSHPDLVEAARDGDEVALHKLSAAASASAESAASGDKGRVANRVIDERFTLDTDPTDLSTEEREEITEFLDREVDSSRTPAVQYADLLTELLDDD